MADHNWVGSDAQAFATGRTLAIQGVRVVGEGLAWIVRTGGAHIVNAVPATEDVTVSDGTKNAMATARHATRSVANAASYVTGIVADAAVETAKHASRKYGNRGQPLELSDTSKKALSGTVCAGAAVLTALIEAGDLVLMETADVGARGVEKRYGKDAGEVAQDAAHTVGNLRDVKNSLGGKAMLKSVGAAAAQKHAKDEAANRGCNAAEPALEESPTGDGARPEGSSAGSISRARAGHLVSPRIQELDDVDSELSQDVEVVEREEDSGWVAA